MSTASEVDYRTPADDPRIAAELVKIGRSRRGDLLLMAARQLVMLADAAKKIDRLQDEARLAGWAREAAEKEAGAAVGEQSRLTRDVEFARRTLRLTRQILFPDPPNTSAQWMPADAGESERRQRDDRRDAAYLRGLVDAAVTLIDGAPSA